MTLRDAVTLVPRVRKPKPKPVIRQKKPMAKLEYKKAYDQRQFAWTCPICKTEFNGTYGSVMGSRRFHWRTKHPDMPSTMIRKEAPTVVAVSFSLPEGEKAWICPLCPAALPSLPTVDKKRAVRDHISKSHKGETLQSLYNRQRCKIKKPGVSAAQTAKFATKRLKVLKGHRPVRVEPTERMQREKRGSHFYYCANCLQRIIKDGPNNWNLTCRQPLAKQKSKNRRYCGIKSVWWRNLPYCRWQDFCCNH